MKIITLQTGELFVNCYIVFKEGKNEAIAIDPGGSEDKIFYKLQQNNLTITHILLTHGHFDHIGAVRAIKEKYGAKICIHKSDAAMLADPAKNLSVFIDNPVIEPSADILLQDKQMLNAGGMDVKVLHTPGHSEGSVCYMIEDALFTGDTLFYMSVGRTDFPGCSMEKMMHSLTHVLGVLKENYTVYPGHGISSTLDEEKCNNPFFNGN